MDEAIAYRILVAISTINFLLISFKMLVTGVATGIARGKTKEYANPEDQKAFAKDTEFVSSPNEDSIVQRIKRIHQNEIENILPFIIVCVAFFT
jgi:hypothetical protein